MNAILHIRFDVTITHTNHYSYHLITHEKEEKRKIANSEMSAVCVEGYDSDVKELI